MHTTGFLKLTVGVIVVFLIIIAVATPIISNIHIASETENPGSIQRFEYVSGEHTILTGDSASDPYIIDGVEYDDYDGYIFVAPYLKIISGNNNDLSITYVSSESPNRIGESDYRGEIKISDSQISFDPECDGYDTIDYTGTAIVIDANGSLSMFDSNVVSWVTVNSIDTVYYVSGFGAGYIPFTDGTSGELGSFVLTNPPTDRSSMVYINMYSFVDNGDGTVQFATDPQIEVRHGISYPSTDEIPGRIIAPLTYSTASESDKTLDSIIQLVPLLMVVGLVVSVSAAFITLKSRGGGA